MRYTGMIVLLVCAVLCCGCRSNAEIDDYSYAMMIGVDEAEEGEYSFSYRVILPQAFAGEGKAEEEKKAKIVSVTASSLSESFREVSLLMNRRLNATHIVGFVFSEEVASRGIYSIISTMNKSVLFRNSVVLVVCEGTARSFMENNKAPFEVFPSRWTESLRDNQESSGAYFVSDAREFYRSLRDKNGAGALTMASSDDSGANAIGSAVFVDWKMVGKLDSEASFGGVVLEKILRVPIDVRDPQEPKQIYSLGVRTFTSDIDVCIEEGRMIAEVVIGGTAELMEMAQEKEEIEGDTLYPTLEAQLNRKIEQAVSAYIARTQAWGADVVGIRDHYRKHTASLREWDTFDWRQYYRMADIRVRAEVNIKRRGYQHDETGGGDVFDL